MGKIAIEGMQFYAYHGHFKEEQFVGNQFIVDIYIETNIAEAAISDDLTKTLNYELVYRIAKDEMKKKSNLLEHAAKRIMDEVDKQFGPLEKLRVRVSKLHPSVRGNVERVYVELEK